MLPASALLPLTTKLSGLSWASVGGVLTAGDGKLAGAGELSQGFHKGVVVHMDPLVLGGRNGFRKEVRKEGWFRLGDGDRAA